MDRIHTTDPNLEIEAVTETVPYEIEVFFDGACPLCVREMGMLRRKDRRQAIRFTNIAAIDFSAEGIGSNQSDLMARIHARLPDGTWIEGVEVFRRLYAAIGFKKLVWLTRLPGISLVLNLFYSVFARNRLRLTGRCSETGCRINPDFHA